MQDKIMALTGTLDTIRDHTQGPKISAGELIKALNSRGYGPLLIGPALITILPTGAIPGVPSLCALLVILISVQILIRRSHPWLPKRLTHMAFDRDQFLRAVEHIKPYTQKIDAFTYPRFSFLIQDNVKPFIAVISIALSIAIMILGFIPFMAMIPAFGILCLGVGLTARDGLLFMVSFMICAASLWALPYGLSKILG